MWVIIVEINTKENEDKNTEAFKKVKGNNIKYWSNGLGETQN